MDILLGAWNATLAALRAAACAGDDGAICKLALMLREQIGIPLSHADAPGPDELAAALEREVDHLRKLHASELAEGSPAHRVVLGIWESAAASAREEANTTAEWHVELCVAVCQKLTGVWATAAARGLAEDMSFTLTQLERIVELLTGHFIAGERAGTPDA